MKKILLSAALAASAFSYSSAQIAGYGFESRVGSYEEITDGTILDLSDLTDMDIYKKAFLKDGRVDGLATGEGMPIGFTFEYNGMQCDQFAVGSNGFVMVGDGSITINPSGGTSMFTYTTEGTSNLFGIIPNCDFTGVTSAPIISYKTIGEAPDRELVVQFSDYYISTTLWGDDLTPVDFQIRLCETTNDIEMIFNGWVAEEGKSYGIRIGIKGEPGQTQTLTSESGDFQNMSTTSSVNMVYFSSTSNVVDGLTYTFTAPMQCEMPASQATGLTMSSTSEAIEGSFTPTDAADHYLVLLSKSASLNELPANTNVYETGDVIGDATVVTYTDGSAFATADQWSKFVEVDGSSTYYVYVIAVNANCKGGPIYNCESPLTGSITTKPMAPTVTVTGQEANSITLDITSNVAGDDVILALTGNIVENDDRTQGPDFDTPSGTYKVGDALGGGTIIYVGKSTTQFEIPDLEPGTSYYLRAYSCNDNGEYSTTYTDVATGTCIIIPYQADFSKAAVYNLPGGWTKESTNPDITFEVNSPQTSVSTEDPLLLCYIFNGNTGLTTSVTTQPVIVDKENATFSFVYNMTNWARMTGYYPYDWSDGDRFSIQASTDGGTTFTTISEYTTDNHPVQELGTDYVPMTADLADYYGQTIYLRIEWECYATQATYLAIEQFKIDAPEPSDIPTIVVSDITHNSAVVTITGLHENYEIEYGEVGGETTAEDIEGNTATLIDLMFSTDYQIRARGINDDGTRGEWSEPVTFTTDVLPECEAPTDLAASLNDDNSMSLSWTSATDNVAWDVRYREATSTSYTTVEGLEETAYTIAAGDLASNTAYLWSVRSTCTYDRTSAWSAQSQFTSAETSSVISAARQGDLKVFASKGGMVNVINPGGIYVKEVSVYDYNGRLLNMAKVEGCDNIVIPANAGDGVAIIIVSTTDRQFTYKVQTL